MLLFALSALRECGDCFLLSVFFGAIKQPNSVAVSHQACFQLTLSLTFTLM